MADRVRFIRVNGRVVPIRGKGSAPSGSGISKRYGAKRDTPKPKSLGVAKGAAVGAVASFAAHNANDMYSAAKFAMKARNETSLPFSNVKLGLSTGYSGMAKSSFGRVASRLRSPKYLAVIAGGGAVLGAAIGSMKFYRAGKGESTRQLSIRASGNKKVNKTGLK